MHLELQEAPNSQRNIEKEEQSWGAHTYQFHSCLLSYSKAIKTVELGHKDRRTDQWNKIRNPEIIPYIYG